LRLFAFARKSLFVRKNQLFVTSSAVEMQTTTNNEFSHRAQQDPNNNQQLFVTSSASRSKQQPTMICHVERSRDATNIQN
jgi:hypothetical protein